MDFTIDGQAKWYALYTRSRAEKMLHKQLTQKGVECFLPLKKELKQYSDRKKWVEEPLIRSYLFVRVDQKDYFRALNTTGAVRYVGFENRAVPIPGVQIQALQQMVCQETADIETSVAEIEKGTRVEIKHGPLAGVQGELLEMRGKHRLLLRFDTIGMCIHTEVELGDVQSC